MGRDYVFSSAHVIYCGYCRRNVDVFPSSDVKKVPTQLETLGRAGPGHWDELSCLSISPSLSSMRGTGPVSETVFHKINATSRADSGSYLFLTEQRLKYCLVRCRWKLLCSDWLQLSVNKTVISRT